MAAITDGLVLFLIAQSFYVSKKLWEISRNNEKIKTRCPLFVGKQRLEVDQEDKEEKEDQ